LISPNGDTCEKNEGGYCILTFLEKKPPSVSQISSPPRRNSSRKIGTVTGKTKNPKNEAERQLRFSQLVAPLKNMEEVFVLHPVLKKTSLGF
jgi:hypothetical protein